MTVEIPFNRLVENTHNWKITGNTASAGQTSGAAVDIRSDGGGFWMATLTNIRFLNRQDTLLWRALRQISNGGIVPIAVPRRDTTWAPFLTGPVPPVPFGDGAYFSDGSGFYQASIAVQNQGSVILRATSLRLRLINCAPLQGGECFSILHPTFGWRLYEIATVADNGDGTSDITFNPPMREAVVDGTDIEFDRPRCLMKLTSASAMDFDNSTYPFSLASVTFVESKYAS